MSSIPEAWLSDVLLQFRKYKAMAEAALAQVDDADFFRAIDPESNSIALVVKHLANNMRSRWTDFLVNAGGAVAITGIEALGWGSARAEEEVRRIGGRLRRVLDLAEADGVSSNAAARRLAEERLRRGPQADGR